MTQIATLRRMSKPAMLIALAASALILVLVFDLAYVANRFRPNAFESTWSWWNWWDQARYLTSTLAFAAGDFIPSKHWYPFGYSLLAAPFVSLAPLDPFYPVNLVCFLALAVALATLGARLGVGAVGGVLALALGVVLPAKLFAQYITPWSTTPVAALYVFALSLYVRALDRGLSRATSIGLAAAVALVATIRPIDAIPLAPIGLHLALSEWGRWKQGGTLVQREIVLAIAIGTAVGAAILVSYLVLHTLVYGFAPSEYSKVAAGIGFDPALIPYRYLLLFNSPREIYGEGTGILEEYPAVALGLLGLVYSMLFCRYKAIPFVVVCSLAIYLSFADFLPYGLWRHGNVHYLKWIFPVLVLLALHSARDLLRVQRVRRLFVAVAIVVPLTFLGFRGEASAAADTENRNGRDVVLTTRGPGPFFAIRFESVHGDFNSLYVPNHRLELDGRAMFNTIDFKALPLNGRASLVLHRPRSFVEARFKVAEESSLRVGGRIELIAPSVGLSSPFRCDTVTVFEIRLC